MDEWLSGEWLSGEWFSGRAQSDQLKPAWLAASGFSR
jgi:hypothetical protein